MKQNRFIEPDSAKLTAVFTVFTHSGHPASRGIRTSVYIIACIEDPVVIEKILIHLERKDAAATAARLPPCRAPPGSMKTPSSCEKGRDLDQHRVEAPIDDGLMTYRYLMGLRLRAFIRPIPWVGASPRPRFAARYRPRDNVTLRFVDCSTHSRVTSSPD